MRNTSESAPTPLPPRPDKRTWILAGRYAHADQYAAAHHIPHRDWDYLSAPRHAVGLMPESTTLIILDTARKREDYAEIVAELRRGGFKMPAAVPVPPSISIQEE